MRYKLLGCPLDVLWPEQILSCVHRAIRTGDTVRVEGLNVAKVIQARRDQTLMGALEEAEVVHLDGVGVALGGRLLGYRMPPRLGGCDLMLDLMTQAVRERYRVYFLGATQEVVSEMAEKLRSRFPGLDVAGIRDGYFGPDEEVAVVDEIRSKRVDLLFVGISSPKKELFIRRWWQELNVKASVGVGGAFDVLSGRVRRAPLYVQRVGLEWLFRLCMEPRRLAYRYLLTNTIFAALLLREALCLNTGRSVRAKDSGRYYD
jgi:N-acetylglucosaminyldiphosphoundecaprenol N-acetyl-beta-D-mannosaminyltransferase